MTEAEWLACTDPALMLEFLRDNASDRKLRLFGVACCRTVWHLLHDTEFHKLIVLTERHADRPKGNKPFRLAEQIINRPGGWTGGRFPLNECNAEHAVLHVAGLPPGAIIGHRYNGRVILADSRFRYAWERLQPVGMARWTSEFVVRALAHQEEDAGVGTARARQEHCRFLRCLFGPLPFPLPPRLPPAVLAWNGGTVRRLAEAVYEERAFDSLPVLADALEDAGCGDEEILNHCRSEGPHVRGCWVIDLLLGKG